MQGGTKFVNRRLGISMEGLFSFCASAVHSEVLT